ncbi:CLUMA_CG001002, isoform A [Clunio marinus]|uniref:CLUMA_CG001002, isoform A n=1 Tax=Clunio marinus TaxID=568069 RepID=A0A1J1HGS1_9DIPT|nr:CLUMA_CG001002, isoform A [Clunio marinus]
MSSNERKCLNEDESKKSQTFPGLKYLQMNCMDEHKQQLLLKYCNCMWICCFLLNFLIEGNFTNCGFKNFKCLNRYNSNLNSGGFLHDLFETASEESCLPECNHVKYAIEVETNILAESNITTLDFNYHSASLVRYRTDMTFGWLDLLVSFGGTACLFLGCSVLSGVELIYHCIKSILMLLTQLLKKLKELFHSQLNSGQVNVIMIKEFQKSNNQATNI